MLVYRTVSRSAVARPSVIAIVSTFRDPEDVLTVLATVSGRRNGDSVDPLEHALQCAANLAATHPDDLELQVAGLVHDIGTVLEPSEPATHAVTGAEAVTPLLGSRVGALVALHEQALRYLATTEVSYRKLLSSRTIEMLRLHGGLLEPAERSHSERPVLRTEARDARIA